MSMVQNCFSFNFSNSNKYNMGCEETHELSREIKILSDNLKSIKNTLFVQWFKNLFILRTRTSFRRSFIKILSSLA